MENVNFYKLVGEIALEYRLSLENLCRLLGKPVNNENKKDIYNKIVSSINGPDIYINLYKYLFNYETINEDIVSSTESYKQASKFLVRYSYAKNKGSKEDVSKVLYDLRKTEEDFKKIEEKQLSEELTPDEIETISKYRIKHLIPRNSMAAMLHVSDNKLRGSEKKLNPILKTKVDLFSEYSQDVALERFRSK